MVESRCGILCSECEYREQMNCNGCVHIEKPFWADACPVKSCCEDKKLEHCDKCNDFPCDLLNQFAYDKEQGDGGKRIERCKKWSEIIRCFGHTPLYADYHDNEWGRPVHDDNKLFEMLILEGAQAGLSWETVLKKREAYIEAFDGFDPKKVALYDDNKIAELMANAGIIRNRLKINAAVINAKLFLEIAERHGSFDKFIWSYVDYTPITGHWEKIEDMPITNLTKK